MTGAVDAFVRFGALGDLVMCTPALRALHARAGRPVVMVAGPQAQGLFAGLPWVERCLSVPSKGSPYWCSPSQWRLVRQLRQLAALGGTAYVTDHDPKVHALVTRAWPAERIVWGGKRPANAHQTEFQLRVVGAADAPPGCELRVADADRTALAAWMQQRGVAQGRRYVLFQAGSKLHARGSRRADTAHPKYWPAERWVEVAQGVLARDAEAVALFTGTAHEQALIASLVAELARRLPGRVQAALLPGGDVRVLLALCAGADGMISVDTGPAHVAAAVGCPLVVLFGRTDPRVNRPRSCGSPVSVVTGPGGMDCAPGERAWAEAHDLLAVMPDQVLAAWQALPRGRAVGAAGVEKAGSG